jgi:uncharacterized protein (TIGR02301 family)
LSFSAAALGALLSPPPGSISVAMLKRGLLIALIAGALAAPAGAAEEQPAPFDGALMRLSEILGGLHYLRGICSPNEGPKWRNQMQALLDAEAPAGSQRRAHMMASFNRGYRGFQQAYRTCTPAADLAIRRYLEEGAKISRDVTARYAN